MLNVLIFGAPGSGKGTQSEELIRRYGFRHISTGELLRAEIKAQTELGQAAAGYINEGHLVPDSLIVDMMEKLISTLVDTEGIIFDGFPRTIPQAEAMETMLAHHGWKVDIVLNLQVPEEMLIERLLNRGKVSGRSDDNIETIRKRLDVYANETAPLVDFFTRKNVLHNVVGTGTIEEIALRIAPIVDKFRKVSN
ncbi:adenylate kinase-like kinase [Porphyromonas gingivalis AJW4]|uniref:Adenylate kinase n=2 Tax=Porphyromonas gingivalis TaxID=837 RepID=KAD_PORGI|nr:adenylate kinase [Porphyromonas gingivalis]Q7MW54.1 RecName: Full=Adenylate kinase; Short=AK; AltName: Full=ATP-AMP transphosphorylase; AltName: Full=ATP:AMP phosphotransferase; AltName: Full=Adenylate monophosphate kinase [Porphyromonas gingivalis W83]AAQ65952.1 adenylate kinase [Porphyromonas gingivalis W83]AKV64375.1 adenylate kinase-like kinase [Porphyromonas gingivalis]ALA93653.1 adenylate kinase-like kinase [Porphyromonas gingivalis AJW4]ATR99664.1 adenylate kinase [Porphyromonas ging